MFLANFKNARPCHEKSTHVAILAHFDTYGDIRDDLVAFANACLRDSIRLILVSTNLSARSREKIPAGVEVITRANFGYDFYSYKYGIAALLNVTADQLSDDSSWDWDQDAFQGRIDKLTLLNSSFYIGSPEKITAAIRSKQETDLQGLTFSKEISPHIQSFFISFNERTLRSETFRSWWQKMTPISERQAVIDAYEIGMTSWFMNAGHSAGAMYQPSMLDTLRSAFSNRPKRKFFNRRIFKEKDKLNPTMYFWPGLWRKFSIVKIELIERNPLQFDLRPLLKDPAFQYQRHKV
jgi:hypothetical protein